MQQRRQNPVVGKFVCAMSDVTPANKRLVFKGESGNMYILRRDPSDPPKKITMRNRKRRKRRRQNPVVGKFVCTEKKMQNMRFSKGNSAIVIK
jgi:hypothetical protein